MHVSRVCWYVRVADNGFTNGKRNRKRSISKAKTTGNGSHGLKGIQPGRTLFCVFSNICLMIHVYSLYISKIYSMQMQMHWKRIYSKTALIMPEARVVGSCQRRTRYIHVCSATCHVHIIWRQSESYLCTLLTFQAQPTTMKAAPFNYQPASLYARLVSQKV